MDKKTTKLFSLFAKRYDFLNHLLSLNFDRYWRKELVEPAALRPDSKILDVCTGTCDVAMEFVRSDFREVIGLTSRKKCLESEDIR